MLIGLISLILLVAICLLIPLYLSLCKIAIPEWIFNMLGAFIGSIVAIIGSVSFQLLTERRKNSRIYEKNLLLLKRELYNNFIVCLHRISNNTCSIDVFDDAYKNFVIADDAFAKKGKVNMYSEISNLYFVISRGHQILKSANTFLDEVLTVQKKHLKKFEDVKEIIQSTGIDYIYEFAIIRYIILLNINYSLDVKLPFCDFEKLVKYEQKNDVDIEESILLYICELVCKRVFNNESILYYHKSLHEKEY